MEISEGIKVTVDHSRTNGRKYPDDQMPFTATTYRITDTNMIAVDNPDGMPVILVRNNGERTSFRVQAA